MCIACREFVKESLTFQEYQRALGEVSRENERHLDEVEELMRKVRNDPEKLREMLDGLA